MIQGALNFRDLGGARIDSSRRVRPNRIFRSGVLHALSDRGVDELSALGVRVVFDLRSDSERAARPPRLPADGSVTHYWRAHDRQTGNLFATLREQGRTATDGRALMHRLYRAIPHDLVDLYRDLFAHIAEARLPIVFNCAAGKDRTGVAAALLLSALGVPFEVILRDYQRSGEAFDDIVEMFLSGPRGALVRDIPRSVWEPILRTDETYLMAAFDSIEQRSGSLANYLRRELQVDEAKQARLQEQMIESDHSA